MVYTSRRFGKPNITTELCRDIEGGYYSPKKPTFKVHAYIRPPTRKSIQFGSLDIINLFSYDYIRVLIITNVKFVAIG
jgi:hypothetical protein